MKNQKMIWAKMARDFFRDKDREDFKVIDSVPSLIHQNGLLVTLLYLYKDEKNRPIANEIMHSLGASSGRERDWLERFCDKTSKDLIADTAKAQGYVAWLKRYRKGMAQ